MVGECYGFHASHALALIAMAVRVWVYCYNVWGIGHCLSKDGDT